jgi:hypothetical protein
MTNPTPIRARVEIRTDVVDLEGNVLAVGEQSTVVTVEFGDSVCYEPAEPVVTLDGRVVRHQLFWRT